MSEETTTVAAPEAPTVQPDAAADAPAPVEEAVAEQPLEQEQATLELDDSKASQRTKRRRKAQERAKAREASAQAALERSRRASEQPREEAGTTTEEGEPAGGRFREGEEPEAAAPTEEAAAEAPSESDEGEAAVEAPTSASSGEQEAAVAAPSSDTVKIPLPEDHPYRSRGITEWEAPADREQEVRGMLNAVAERAQYREQNARLREEQALLEARLQAQRPYQASPEDEAWIKDNERAWGPEKAELMRRALGALNEQAIHSAEQQARQQIHEQRASEQFVHSVQAEWSQRFPVWAKQGHGAMYMAQALDRYGELLDKQNAGRAQVGQPLIHPDPQQFFRWVATRYAQDPAVREQFQRTDEERLAEERERIRAEERTRLAEAEKEKLAEAAKRHSQLPPGTSQVSSSGDSRRLVEEEESVPRTRSERRRAIAQRFSGR